MLELTDNSSNVFRIYVVDAHHHLGVDVDGQSNRNPAAPGGTFDFCLRLSNHLLRILSNGSVDLKFRPHGFMESLLESEEKWKDSFNGTWAIDQTVVFPFNDVFKWREGDEGKATYWRSNDNIHRWTTRAPYSLKLIGYARIIPHEGELAIKELHRAVKQLGLRGVKLHPRSDGWGNEIDSEPVENFLVEAAKLGVPVIFDTRGFSQVIDIAEVTTKARAKLVKMDKQLARQLKVLIAHIGFHLSHDELYTVLSHPNIYGEVSGIHDAGIRKLFEEAPSKLKETMGPYHPWSEKIIFGTDFPYFDIHHAAQFISFTISENFPGTIKDAQRILGANILRLIPPRLEKSVRREAIHVNKELFPEARRMLASRIAKLLSEGKADIFSFDVFFSLPPKVDVRDDCLLIIKGKEGNGKSIPLMLLTLMSFGVVVHLDNGPASSEQLIISRELGYDDSLMRQHFYSMLWPDDVEEDQSNLERRINLFVETIFEGGTCNPANRDERLS